MAFSFSAAEICSPFIPRTEEGRSLMWIEDRESEEDVAYVREDGS